jgi:hypothetical protein
MPPLQNCCFTVGNVPGKGGGDALVADKAVCKMPKKREVTFLYESGENKAVCEMPTLHSSDYSKAVKSDDARVPVELWDKIVWMRPHSITQLAMFRKKFVKCPLETLRSMCLTWWRSHVRKEGLNFLKSKPVANKEEHEAVWDCITRCCQADFWEWNGGSRLLFWRWPSGQQKEAMQGYRAFVKKTLPKYRQPQPKERNEDISSKVRKKLNTVRERGYIAPGRVESLTGYFAVPKGIDDIRMVYDASRSGLNASIWAPNFSLPSVESLLREVDQATWMGDVDIGEMFLNFCLDPLLQEYCGVDLRPYLGGETSECTWWERWVRCMMGLKWSPYVCIKALLLALEWVKGDLQCTSNPFHWSKILFNLPGQEGYDPTRAWVSRMKCVKGEWTLASGMVCYVDDLRPTGSSEEDCWRVMHHISSRLNYLGIQIALRKHRPPSRQPGAWAGSIVISNAQGVAVTCTVEKWLKAKQIVREILVEVEKGEELDRKSLERSRGFLVHVQRTYPAITPYLKGLHLTIDSWRGGRDEEGWTG